MTFDPDELARTAARERAARQARNRLDELVAQLRRDVGALAETWRGGHQESFSAEVSRLTRAQNEVRDALGRIQMIERRALDAGVTQ